ncbi:MAG: sigma-70 family RNA polymerase sigma factor [Pirellulaceae bacterium]|nr:sigma-70 family RNA polymerase sigma factor [Pirellulaceae bacterium]
MLPRPEHEHRETTPQEVDRFVTTHWSLVIAAGQRESPESAAALVTLCTTYWYPLYAFVRRQGYRTEDAQDLTQAFFAKLLEKNYIGDADQQRGRFRSFLLASLKRFLSNERDYARAKKRGGGRPVISLDFESAESRYNHEPADTMTAERLFERRWALTLLDQVLNRLHDEYAAAGNLPLFERLKEFLTAERRTAPYRVVAHQAGMTEGAVKVAVHRLRKRYRQLLEEEIAQTVSRADDVQDELYQLFTSLSSDLTLNRR